MNPDTSLHAYQKKREVHLSSPPLKSDILLISYGGDFKIIELNGSFSRHAQTWSIKWLPDVAKSPGVDPSMEVGLHGGTHQCSVLGAGEASMTHKDSYPQGAQ